MALDDFGFNCTEVDYISQDQSYDCKTCGIFNSLGEAIDAGKYVISPEK